MLLRHWITKWAARVRHCDPLRGPAINIHPDLARARVHASALRLPSGPSTGKADPREHSNNEVRGPRSPRTRGSSRREIQVARCLDRAHPQRSPLKAMIYESGHAVEGRDVETRTRS